MQFVTPARRDIVAGASRRHLEFVAGASRQRLEFVATTPWTRCDTLATVDITPDATQPRVTVRPKPPALLGATSETHRRRHAKIVSDNPGPGLVRWLQGSHLSVTRSILCRKLPPAPAANSLRSSMPTLDRALRLSLGHLPIRLAALLLASLQLTLRWSVRVRRAFISGLVTPCSS